MIRFELMWNLCGSPGYESGAIGLSAHIDILWNMGYSKPSTIHHAMMIGYACAMPQLNIHNYLIISGRWAS